ncbi:flavodoxin family protein [Thermodesulfobacteriota bacterium]
MKAIIIYCSKTGNTEKVAAAMQRGLQGAADIMKLNLNHDGLLNEYYPDFTLDLAGYDLIFLGGWTMVMRVHPYLAAYIQKCEHLEGKQVVGFLTAGAIFSRGHVREDFSELVEARGGHVYDFAFITTLLGLTLTRKKLLNAERFAADVAGRLQAQLEQPRKEQQ